MNKIMTNEQKYKTPDERVKAFMDFYREQKAETCERCMFHKNGCIGSKVSRGFLCYQNWLALPCEEEKLENCPFCGGMCVAYDKVVACQNEKCDYRSGTCNNRNAAISAHNRVARAVRAAEKGEVK